MAIILIKLYINRYILSTFFHQKDYQNNYIVETMINHLWLNFCSKKYNFLIRVFVVTIAILGNMFLQNINRHQGCVFSEKK
jgi:hypothetical protein